MFASDRKMRGNPALSQTRGSRSRRSGHRGAKIAHCEADRVGNRFGVAPGSGINVHYSAFNTVYLFLQKQAHRPFLKRYLKRDEILKQIQGCDAELQEALGMFSVSAHLTFVSGGV